MNILPCNGSARMLAGKLGDTIDVRHVLREVEAAANDHGLNSEVFFESPEVRLLALTNGRNVPGRLKVYVSTGIHGDEPAGPLAMLQLIRENRWPDVDLWLCPCLNPLGFTLNSRENSKGIDLNREYLKPMAPEVTAHIAWLERQPKFDLCLLMHEDWESYGFYLYEQNPDGRRPLAEPMIEAVSRVCPIDPNELIEGRPAKNGIIRPNLDPRTRPQWPEAFYLITHKTRLSYTLEAPSDYPMQTRVEGLVTAVRVGIEEMLGSAERGVRSAE